MRKRRTGSSAGGVRAWRIAFALLLACAPVSAPWAEPTATGAHSPERDARRLELDAIERDLRGNLATRAALEGEIASLREDRARLSAALVASAAAAQALESRVEESAGRLNALEASQEALGRSLEARRELLAEVLAVLQRIGRKPPPALLAQPQGILAAVRASIGLSAVLPELRAETGALARDLAALGALGREAAAERERLAAELTAAAGERVRLAALVEARQRRLADTERSAAEEAGRAGDLAGRARSLRDLLQRLEVEAGASRAAEEARRAAAAQAAGSGVVPPAGGAGDAVRERITGLALKDPARLAPKIAFGETRGLLPLPARGPVVRAFGAPDGTGLGARGISIETRPAGVVTAPADGWVAFAGPFRSFGRLLILNAGNGYYILMAGMERIDVALGQFVLAGEPVALMGAGPAQGTQVGQIGAGPSGSGHPSRNPVLYVEFRKDGTSIDPSPWWARLDNEKVRG